MTKSRLPAIFLQNTDNKLYVYMDSKYWKLPALEKDVWHDIVISKQKPNNITIKFDDTFKVNSNMFSTEENYEKVTLFLSDPWYEDINGFAEIRNLQIRNFEPYELPKNMENWGESFFIAFAIQMTKAGFEDNQNIVNIANKDGLGVNVYIDGETKNLIITMFLNGKMTHADHTLMLQKDYKIIISQEKFDEKTLFNVFINGDKIYEIENVLPQNFGDVEIKASESITEFGVVFDLKVFDHAICK